MQKTSMIVGRYKESYNDILNISLPVVDIVQSDGLRKHIEKRHPDCLDLVGYISEIIERPDYIGCNPNEPSSLELIKKYNDNLLVAIKLDKSKESFYVASLYKVHDSKVRNKEFLITS